MAEHKAPILSAEDELLLKVDRESAYRRLTGKWAMLITFMGIGLTLFHVYTAAYMPFAPQLQRSPHLAIALGMVFILYPARKGDIRDYVPWYDVVLAGLGLLTGFYNVVFYEALIGRAGLNTTLDMVASFIGIVLILEATRRVIGWAMVIVAMIFLSYALFGNWLPGLFAHRGYSMERVLEHTFLTTEGVFGVPLGVSATVIFVYLLFAQFLAFTGIRNFFIDIAMVITGRSPGGPAKAAVVSSALEGTISGSSIANTVGSGSFTIPMMKKLGYRPEFAAAVEASASTGGQIMPPIMGAAAFVMVEFLNIPYLDIAKAAIIPAALYFTAVFIMVHFEAKRLGMKGLAGHELPDWRVVVFKQGYLIIPLVAIIFLMDAGYGPAKAAIYATVLAWGFGMIKKETRMWLKEMLKTFEETARGALSVIIACATAGIIVGIVSLTGVGLKLSLNMIDLAGNNLWMALLLTMFASIVLGMGIPTTATYIVLATMAAPALVTMGVVPIAAHLFVFYFGIVADITPPVALAVYAGAAIAGSNPWKTGIEAVKLASGAFLVPFIFAFSPSLLLIDVTPMKIALILFTSITGMVALGAGVTGFWTTNLRYYERIALIAGGILMVEPAVMTDVVGIGLVVGSFALQYFRSRDGKSALAA